MHEMYRQIAEIEHEGFDALMPTCGFWEKRR